MKKKKPFLKNFSLKTKCIFLIFLVILYVVLVAVQFVFRHRNDQSMDESIPAFETETMEESAFEQTDHDETLASVENNETDSETDTMETINRVTIKDLDPMATQIMGSNANLLEEKLYEYNLANGIVSTKATLIEAAASTTRDKTMEFYVENDDGTLVTLFWDPYYQVVDAETCKYTKEDIENNVWMFSEGEPVEHGITSEEEQAFFDSMKETEGENDGGSQTENTDTLPEDSNSK